VVAFLHGIIDRTENTLSEMQQEASMIPKRAQELLDSIKEPEYLPNLQEMAEEVRASLPPTKKMLSKYMRAHQGLFPL